MSFNIHFLGTGCMVPTKERNHLSIALEYKGDIFLFDCGEHTQLQIRKLKLHTSKIKKIFISHWHGDHVIGLPGLLMTLSNTQGVGKIEIHGPKGTKQYLEYMQKAFIFDGKLDLDIIEHTPDEEKILNIIKKNDFSINCVRLNHSIDCLAYSFEEKDVQNIDMQKAKQFGLSSSPLLARAKMGLNIEHEGQTIEPKDITYTKKGKKISLVFDTRPCKEIDMLVKDSSILIMEATYLFETHGHKAEEYDHMSAKETAEIALRNNVETLMITHFSQRYKDITPLEQEARDTFKETIATYDLMTYKVR